MRFNSNKLKSANTFLYSLSCHDITVSHLDIGYVNQSQLTEYWNNDCHLKRWIKEKENTLYLKTDVVAFVVMMKHDILCFSWNWT